ncbi:centrosomal protein of 95 kDa isoform X7 [Dermochelys coriacea]|uniref:centrosomal protein of 95 kDa isoform X7 n=1 Tax=Dermochelys coriacea TaxID=27794 RepID=UPI0018E8557A|nr:centrosomal protein of 95 kDa isoform X7 [Dermochelys coriacea]
MGSPEERDWVDVANDLLMKCHINLHVTKLTECGANVFVGLYESILGEKVPDFIASPKSQEDDAHNVQAVIDSLALDYLQVSLSHVTEQISETSSQNGDEPDQLANNEIQRVLQEQLEGDHEEPVPPLKLPSVAESSQSDIFVPSWDVEGSESTSELIRLGDTAHSFSLRKEEFELPEMLPAERERSKEIKEPEDSGATVASCQLVVSSSQLSSSRRALVKEREGSMDSVNSTEFLKESLSSSAKKLGEPIRPAIPLQPPYQPPEPMPHYSMGREYQSSARQFPGLANSHGLEASVFAEPLRQESTTSDSVSLSRLAPVFPVGDKAVSKDERNGMDDVAKALDVDASHTSTTCLHQDISPGTDQVISVARITKPETRSPSSGKRSENFITNSFGEEPLSCRRAKNKLSEQELHEMSEKLSRRLNELDLMLKRALGEHPREEMLTDEDKLSQHSDSVMDYRGRKPHQATPHPKRFLSRPRSLSPSPPSSRYLPHSEFEDALQRDARGQMGKTRRQLQKEMDQRRIKAKLMTKAYEEELRIFEAREKLGLSKLKAKARETEQEYQENIFKEPPKMPRPVKVYSRKTTPRLPKQSQWIPRGGFAKPKKAAQMKVKDNDLLPLLLEEFPYLHISHQSLNKMWQQQLAQMEQLKSASGKDRSRLKLQSEVEEALKKHDLLVDIIKKDQDHNKRLQEFKQRIYRQKFAQNKMREKRQQIAQAKKYYEDYRVQLRAKMMRARTREERIFKNLFEEGLEIQKQRLQELRTYSKEKRAEQRRVHQNELESMENYYKDQFSMLAEAVSQERQEIQARERAQVKTLHKTKRELRSKMEKDIQQLQSMITQNDDDSFFQELEAERLKSRLQMASFQYSKNYFL